MSTISNNVERLIQVQGWNDASLISLLYRFIEKQDLADELEDFLEEQADEENGVGEDEDEESEVRRRASTLSREACVQLLENVSIACFDHESDAVLREAVAVNVLDGTIDIDDFDAETL